MLTIFNRKELMTTFDRKRQANVRQKLADADIDYRVRVVSLCGMDRSRTGSVGIRTEAQYQYYIYVKREDYDRARALL